MILYSIIPTETVFANMEQVEKRELEEITNGHATMLVERTGPYEGRIVRLISPDPQDYLKPHYAPGQKVQFRPEWLV
ncbi:YlzJ-like family protein [Brevibacillus parabrevis]|uniref:YlzJ-like family protein n=1 Tax=Brevibacillus parabrevis TaxID=54914 RepID=UPI002E23F7A6|nr:YlzJ-like family protein [Brevibacillus parabrevis]